MLTPFTEDNKIDFESLSSLIDWYIEKGVSGLFSVCQSSEMFLLSLEERVQISRFVKEQANGRVPVIASGHISKTFEGQVEELNAIAETGVDAIILITNRLATKDEDDDIFKKKLYQLMERLPQNIPLGFYECPYPYKRIISPELLKELSSTERFYFHKDTSCDIDLIRLKIEATKGTSLSIYNANTITLRQSLIDGAVGYSGVMANFHPELYVWLCENYTSKESEYVSDIISLCALIERQLYPVNAKYYLKLLGLDINKKCRVQNERNFTPAFAKEVETLKNVTIRLKKELKIS